MYYLLAEYYVFNLSPTFTAHAQHYLIYILFTPDFLFTLSPVHYVHLMTQTI